MVFSRWARVTHGEHMAVWRNASCVRQSSVWPRFAEVPVPHAEGQNRPEFKLVGFAYKLPLTRVSRNFIQNLGGSAGRRKFREIWVGCGTFASRVEFREIFVFRWRSNQAQFSRNLGDSRQCSRCSRHQKSLYEEISRNLGPGGPVIA